MCQINNTTKESQKNHITASERLIIEHLFNVQNLKRYEIAKELGKHKSTIGREIKLGLIVIEHYAYELPKAVYSAKISQDKHDFNATAKGSNLKISNAYELVEFIDSHIKNNRSPEVISKLIEQDDRFDITLSTNTIYSYVDSGILDSTRDSASFLVITRLGKGYVRRKMSYVSVIKLAELFTTDLLKLITKNLVIGKWILLKESRGLTSLYCLF